MFYNKLALLASFAAGAYAVGSPALDARAAAITLDPANVQQGSTQTGVGDIGSDAGQAASDTSTENFINFCTGKTLTNGLQLITGSCNGIPMGDIPAKTNMISSIILNPPNGGTIASDVTFNITVQTANLVAGSFTDADTTYYAGPQFLSGGNVVGHTHVTVQNMGKDLNPTVPLDATEFAFFKGINDPGNGKGLLTAVVTGGLPAGNYRVCTLTSASNHQPVLMPVAQRGSQDDCTKFVVTGDGTTINVAANDGSTGIAAAAAVSEAAAAFASGGVAAELLPSTSAAAAVDSTSAAATVATTAAGKGGKKASTGSGSGKAAGAGSVAAASATEEASSATPEATTAAAAVAGKGGKGSKGGAGNKVATTPTLATATGASTAAATGAKTASKGGKGFGKPGKYHRGRKQRFARRQFVA